MIAAAHLPPGPCAAEPLLPLPGADEVHLWLLDCRELSDARLEGYRGLLSEEEADQHGRYVLARARREHLGSRALLRCCLSRYAAVAPGRWQFARQGQGKPMVVAPALERPLHFNLTHSRELLCCAVASGPEIGVDLEHTARVKNLERVARAVLAPAELAQLAQLPAQEGRQRFFVLWTLKEAYLKARGTGLRLPLRQLAFAPAEDGTIRACFGPGLQDDPARWWFASFTPAEGFQAAVVYPLPAAGNPPALVMRTLSL